MRDGVSVPGQALQRQMEVWEVDRGQGAKQDQGHSDTAMPAVPARADVVMKQSSDGSRESSGPYAGNNLVGGPPDAMAPNMPSAGPPGNASTSGMRHGDVSAHWHPLCVGSGGNSLSRTC